MEKNEKNYEACPIRPILDVMSNKWTLLILYELSNDYDYENANPLRFNELFKSIEGISQKMLTQSLRLLEEDGFIARKVYPEVPPRVEYSLTEMGKRFVPQIESLSLWAAQNIPEIILARGRYRRRK